MVKARLQLADQTRFDPLLDLLVGLTSRENGGPEAMVGTFECARNTGSHPYKAIGRRQSRVQRTHEQLAGLEPAFDLQVGLPGLVVLGVQRSDFVLDSQGSQAPLDSMIRSGNRGTPKRHNLVALIALHGPTSVHNALRHVPHTFVE